MHAMMSWRFAASVMLAVVVGGGLNGCDYWPPEIQTQIEQLKAELPPAPMERAKLQNPLSAAAKAREELQARVDELTRLNREKTAMIATLEHSLAAERDKLAKLTKAGAIKAAAKGTAKSAGKSTSSKKRTEKSSGTKRK